MYKYKYLKYKTKYLNLENNSKTMPRLQNELIGGSDELNLASQAFEFEPRNKPSPLVLKAIAMLLKTNKNNRIVIDLGQVMEEI